MGSLTKAGMHHSPGLSDAMGSHQTLPCLHHQIQSWSCHRPGETPRGNSPSRQDRADTSPSSRNPHSHPKSHSAFLLAHHHCFRIPGWVGGGGAVDFSSTKPGSCFCSESFLQGTHPVRSFPQPNPVCSLQPITWQGSSLAVSESSGIPRSGRVGCSKLVGREGEGGTSKSTRVRATRG